MGVYNPFSRQQISRIIFFVLGIVFLVAGILKGLDLDQFGRQIMQYDLLPDVPWLITLTARVVVAIEIALGAALLVNWRQRFSVFSVMGLLLLFIAILAHGMIQGTLTDCGCFGPAASRSPIAALIEDLLMLAGTIIAWQMRGETRHYFRPVRSWLVVASLVMSLILPYSSDALRSFHSSANTPSTADITMVSQAGESLTFSEGNTLLALMSTECNHCREAVPVLNQIAAEQEDIVHVTAVSASPEPEIQRFIEENFTFYPVLAVEENSFSGVMENYPLPQYLLICNGRIIARWHEETPEPKRIARLIQEAGRG